MREIKYFQAKPEEKAMIASITAMKKSEHYLKEADAITEEFDGDLPEDTHEW